MKELKYILVGLVLVFAGCSNNQPSVDLSKKEIRTIEGKHYRVPVGVSTSNYAVDSKVIKRYQEFGVTDCQDGDITWEEQTIADAIGEVMRHGTKSEGIAIYEKAASEGKIGCVSALSDEEYQASLNK